MSFELYKIAHLFGVATLVVSLAGVAVHMANGGSRSNNNQRVLLAVLHSIGIVLVLVAGFGMLAKLQLAGRFPLWVVAKVVIWFVAGALLSILFRVPKSGRWVLLILPFLVGLASYFAIVKPV